MERKQFTAELKAVDEQGRGVAIISTTGTVDADGDIVEAGAFGRQRVVFLRGHDWQSFPLGHAEIHEEGDKAIANLELNLTSSAGRAAYDWLKWDHARGGLQEFSYGFSIAQPGGSEMERLEDGRSIRRLKKVRLHEVSMVVRGAGVGTGLVAIKGGDLAAQTAALVAGYHRMRERALKLAALEDPAPADGAHRYRFIALHPRDERHRFVYRAAKAAAAELGIECPVVRWFEKVFGDDRMDFASDVSALGYAWVRQHAIGLNVTQGPGELVDTIRHECAHLAGHGEDGAERFARQGAKLFGDAPRSPGSWTGDQLLVAAAFTRHRGGF